MEAVMYTQKKSLLESSCLHRASMIIKHFIIQLMQIYNM